MNLEENCECRLLAYCTNYRHKSSLRHRCTHIRKANQIICHLIGTHSCRRPYVCENNSTTMFCLTRRHLESSVPWRSIQATNMTTESYTLIYSTTLMFGNGMRIEDYRRKAFGPGHQTTQLPRIHIMTECLIFTLVFNRLEEIVCFSSSIPGFYRQ
jgi:hypothetical protein